MNKYFLIAVVALIGLSSCSDDLFKANAAPMTLTFQFENFAGSPADCILAGGFDSHGWDVTPAGYQVTWTGGNSNTVTVPNQISTDKILFRLVDSSWGTPTGIDYSVLEPNAWGSLSDHQSYASTDPNWGVGNGAGDAGSGIAGPGTWVPDGSTHAIVIDAKNGAGRASLSVDGTVYWGN
jgi:hypothetical protein